ncbi:Kinesin-like protein [Sesbania bispinosa]|nr:Kinesin-like protein [Sesbania bispinosa]
MASNNALALAEKRARKEASKAAAVAAVATSTQNASKSEGGEASNARAKKGHILKNQQVKITWATPDSEEYAALKLLSQQGQVGTWCLRGAMMAEFFHNTIDEVASLPTIKKDFEAVTEKLKADEVKMTEALGKVKTLTDENIHLEENNTKLTEELTKLKAALAAKKTEAIQVVLEKKKVVEDAEADKENWRQRIKFLNLGVELRIKGMSTLCLICDGKWYHGVGKNFVEEILGDEEITPPPIKPAPLKEEVKHEEKKGPTEYDMVDLGLGDSNA